MVNQSNDRRQTTVNDFLALQKYPVRLEKLDSVDGYGSGQLGLVALEDIGSSEIFTPLLVTIPAATVNIDYDSADRCAVCMSKTSANDSALFRCSRCAKEYYCSTDCQRKDWKDGHAAMCKLIAKRSEITGDFVRNEEMLVRILHFLKNTEEFDNEKDKDEVEDERNNVGVEVIELIDKLNINKDEDKNDNDNDDEKQNEMKKGLRNAFLLLKGNENVTGKYKISDDQIQLAKMVADNVSRFKFLKDHTSMIDINKFKSFYLTFDRNNFIILDHEFCHIREATYPLAALINHSCSPNCVYFFAGNIMIIRPIKEIKKYEQLTIPYFDTLKSYDERQKICQKQYNFRCQCIKCTAYENNEKGYKFLDKLLSYPCDKSKFPAIIDNLYAPTSNLIDKLYDSLILRKKVTIPIFKPNDLDSFITNIICSVLGSVEQDKDKMINKKIIHAPRSLNEFNKNVNFEFKDLNLDMYQTSRNDLITNLENTQPSLLNEENCVLFTVELFSIINSTINVLIDKGLWIVCSKALLFILSFCTLYYDSPYNLIFSSKLDLLSKFLWNASQCCNDFKESEKIEKLSLFFLRESLYRQIIFDSNNKNEKNEIDLTKVPNFIKKVGGSTIEHKMLLEPIFKSSKLMEDAKIYSYLSKFN